MRRRVRRLGLFAGLATCVLIVAATVISTRMGISWSFGSGDSSLSLVSRALGTEWGGVAPEWDILWDNARPVEPARLYAWAARGGWGLSLPELRRANALRPFLGSLPPMLYERWLFLATWLLLVVVAIPTWWL